MGVERKFRESLTSYEAASWPTSFKKIIWGGGYGVWKDPLRWGIWCIFFSNHIDNLLLPSTKNRKRSPWFYEPFQVLTSVGYVTYWLSLPSSCKIHLIFHVSSLKKKIGHQVVAELKLPLVNDDGQVLFEPIAILDRHIVKHGNFPKTQVLGHSVTIFLTSNLKDKVLSRGRECYVPFYC